MGARYGYIPLRIYLLDGAQREVGPRLGLEKNLHRLGLHLEGLADELVPEGVPQLDVEGARRAALWQVVYRIRDVLHEALGGVGPPRVHPHPVHDT
eukprot:581277-Pyramimonas_sp.AAC.1